MCPSSEQDEWVLKRDYLDHLIVEQKCRALTLKDLIETPVKSSYLLQLVERCTSLLNAEIAALDGLRHSLYDETTDIRQIRRKIRMIIKQISVVESYGIPSLRFQSPEVDFLNVLVFDISEEIGLPIAAPSVGCLSTDYFYFEPITRVIYVPLAESDFLLHLPDLFHEIGHNLLFASSESNPGIKLRPLAQATDKMSPMIADYFRDLIRRSQMRAGPREVSMVLERAHANWKDWLTEFLSDLFAVYTLGPAFVWSNYHLVAKVSDNAYQSSWFSSNPHPANEARMRLMLHAAGLIGFSKEKELIGERWTDLKAELDSPDAYYDMAYPDTLLQEIATIFLASLKQCGVSIVSPETLAGRSPQSVRSVLNNAWTVFWKTTPEEYRKWETQQLFDLKQSIQRPKRVAIVSLQS